MFLCTKLDILQALVCECEIVNVLTRVKTRSTIYVSSAVLSAIIISLLLWLKYIDKGEYKLTKPHQIRLFIFFTLVATVSLFGFEFCSYGIALFYDNQLYLVTFGAKIEYR